MFAEAEESLVPRLAPLTVAQCAIAMRYWHLGAEARLDPPDPAEPPSSLYLSRLMEGRSDLKGNLDAESAEVLAVALRQAASDDVEGEAARTPAHRRADALIDICRWFLTHHDDTSASSRHRPHINVVVDPEDLGSSAGSSTSAGAPTGARVVDGPYLDAATIERILCDAGVHRVVTAGRSLILDLGRMTKVVSSSQWAALVMRDECCRFPGCDRPSGWCEAHHVVWWSQGGPTRLENLMLACTRHHHLIHSPGWQAKLLPDASVEVTTPDGRVLTSHPPPRGSPRLPFGSEHPARPSTGQTA
jgi:hypothetical protein